MCVRVIAELVAMRRTLSINISKIISAYLLVLVFPLCYGQNLKDPEFKNESNIVQIMLSDSTRSFSNDTITIYLVYYHNGPLKAKMVYFHPEGAPKEKWLYSHLNYAESAYNEEGKIVLYAEWYNNKLHGDYMQFDSEKFVTHWIYENGILVDIKNDNCRYLGIKGNVITKEEFFKQFQTKEFGHWGYYLFEKEHELYQSLKCCDYVMHSDRFNIPPGFPGKEAEKLIKRLNKTCY